MFFCAKIVENEVATTASQTKFECTCFVYRDDYVLVGNRLGDAVGFVERCRRLVRCSCVRKLATITSKDIINVKFFLQKRFCPMVRLFFLLYYRFVGQGGREWVELV